MTQYIARGSNDVELESGDFGDAIRAIEAFVKHVSSSNPEVQVAKRSGSDEKLVATLHRSIATS